MSESLVSILTALADDELVLGHRHSEWTGFAPQIEEDVAFSSIAQDEIGHAAAYYSIIASINGDDPDRLALGRDPSEYRNAILCERPNKDWSYSLARHWLYDHADAIRLESMEGTAHEGLRALINKMRREERYHLIHASAWIKRVIQGPIEGRSKMIDALTQAHDDAMGLFEPFELEDQAVAEGWIPVPSVDLRQRFVQRVTAALDDLGVPAHFQRRADTSAEFVASSSGDLIAGDGEAGAPEQAHDGLGGRTGRRSSAFDALWDDLTAMYRVHPGATW
jgi:ring-1,2-phenylacetyl-CoA epoxidase subunit PaaC